MHYRHEASGADHYLVPTDGGDQATCLVVGHGVHPAEEAALDLDQVAEQLGQSAAGQPDHGGSAAGHPLQRDPVEGFNPLGLDAAHREQIIVLQQHIGLALLHGEHAIPSRQRHGVVQPVG